MNTIKTEMVVSKNGNLGSEKIVNMSNNNKMKIRVCPKQQDFSSASSNGMLCDRQAQFLVQNHANFKKSGEPGRVMYYDSNGSWVDYPEEVLDLLKLSFREGKAIVEVSMQGCNCLVDLYRMLEIEFDTGREKSVAWIDVDGKCFFPKNFVNSGEGFVGCDENDGFKGVLGDNSRKIEIQVKVLENSDNQENLNKRKRENEEIEVDQVVKGKSVMNSPNVKNFKAKRQQLDANVREMGVPRWSKTRVLREEEKQYVVVKDLFLSGLKGMEPGATLTRIHQCTRNGPLEKARYEVFINHMEAIKKARGDSNTVFAWYGTSAKGIESILDHGFVVPDEVLRPQNHGVGAYLSPVNAQNISAMLSKADDNGEKHVVLCRVILGKCEKVEAGTLQTQPSNADFDTGVDDLANPKWYVVWHSNMNTRILPEMVVSYKGSDKVQGLVTCISSAKLVPPASGISLPELCSKLGRSLPPPKAQEVQTLLGSIKDGKVGIHVFLQQLRSIVGEEMLRAVIRGLRG